MHFVSSLGIGCIVEFGQEFSKKGGSVNLVCHTPRLLAEFKLMRLNEVIHIFDECDKAIESVSGVPPI